MSARKLIVQIQLSIDGYCATASGQNDFIFPHFEAASSAWIVEKLHQAGAHLMGRKTYGDMAAHWPKSDEPYAPLMNNIPKVVFSRTLREATWGESRIASGDLATEIARLKAEPGKDLLAHGGAAFVQSLARADLVDEYRLMVHPVALGAGLPLFPPPAPGAASPRWKLRLVRSTSFPGGIVANEYVRA